MDGGLPVDIRWVMVQKMRGVEIVACRCLSKGWRGMIDGVHSSEWQRLYHSLICDALIVGDEFDWYRAALTALVDESSVDALCMWNLARVRIVSPWKEPSLHYDHGLRALCESRLRSNVSRDIRRDHTIVDFIYSNKIRLRGILKTCRLQKGATTLCINCRNMNRQRCTSGEYEYFIRETDPHDRSRLDELLSHFLRTPNDR